MKQFILFVFFLLIQGVGILAQTLEWHIKNQYVDIRYMGNQLFKVKTHTGKWGIVNEYGEMSVEARYDSITPLVEDRALLLDATGQYLKGIVNETGKLIKVFNDDVRLANYSSFREGLLPYGVIAGSYYLFGYLDTQGNVAISPKYFWAAPFTNEVAVVQHKSKNFSLINRSGDPVIKDNRRFKFMSTPVNGHLIFAVGSSRGEKVVAARLNGRGGFTDENDLESGTIVRCANDYRSVTCQNGHVYYVDEAMRVISSSHGLRFNAEETVGSQIPSVPSLLRKINSPDGWRISYEGKDLFRHSFKQVDFCGKDFVLLTSARKCGVLRLNTSGSVRVQNPSQQVEFYHNEPSNYRIPILVEGLQSSTPVKVVVEDTKRMEKTEALPLGHSGIYNFNYSSFVPYSSSTAQGESLGDTSLPATVKIYLQDMLYQTQTVQLRASHKPGFTISEATSPKYSNPNGSAIIRCIVRSHHGVPSSSASVTVCDTNIQSKSFNGREAITLDIPVSVPSEQSRTFSFLVKVTEDGCMPVSRRIECTISHYNLQ